MRRCHGGKLWIVVSHTREPDVGHVHGEVMLKGCWQRFHDPTGLVCAVVSEHGPSGDAGMAKGGKRPQLPCRAARAVQRRAPKADGQQHRPTGPVFYLLSELLLPSWLPRPLTPSKELAGIHSSFPAITQTL